MNMTLHPIMGQRPVDGPIQGYKARPFVLWLIFGILIWSMALRFGGLQLVDTLLRQQVVAAQYVQPASQTKAGQPIGKPTSTGGATITPGCTRDTSYQLPSAIVLRGAPAGLSTQYDQPSHYQIHGNDVDELSAQMAACAPSLSAGLPAEFASETSYNLTWQYGYVAVDGQHCAVTNPKVGLHINMVLPDWQQSSAAANGFAPSWQSFITSLVTHENGHVALDKQYAATLLSDVQNQPPMDCSSIVSTVQAIAEHDVTLLNQANDNYDALTDHGATQGALLR